jgi:hypothetical protein
MIFVVLAFGKALVSFGPAAEQPLTTAAVSPCRRF